MEIDAPSRVDRIRELNDQLRTQFVGGAIMLTRAVKAIPETKRAHLLAAIRGFEAFTEDNDPHGEHDCFTLEFEGERYMVKIDYYDLAMKAHSDDPADLAKTRRVMTVMFASEY
jgi:hypothetical protein